MNTYKAFGLTIASEVILPELAAEGPNEADVTIRYGKVPNTFEDVMLQTSNKKIGRDKFILDNEGIARYYVEKGNLIILEPYEECFMEEVRLYLLGSCMGAILHQRGIMPFHGSCINIEGQGVLITGKSGAGKSTIASAFLDKGCGMITDDVAAVVIDKYNIPIVYPSYPSQKLWQDAIERMSRKIDIRHLNRISNDLSKYSVASINCFYDKPIPLKIVFEIVPCEVDGLKIEEVKGADKLNIIMKNVYRRFMIKAMSRKEWGFKQCTKIADKVLAYRIMRPQDEHLEKEIADVIFNNILS